MVKSLFFARLIGFIICKFETEFGSQKGHTTKTLIFNDVIWSVNLTAFETKGSLSNENR